MASTYIKLPMAITSGGSGDGKVKITASDTTGDFLNAKITSTFGTITKTVVNGGGNESLNLEVDETALDFDLLSPLTTKGDLLGYSTTNTRLGVGTDGQVLTADSAEATGLKWATIDATNIADGSVTNTEFQYINTLSSNAQDQIDARVVGPGSSTDNIIPTFDSTTGKVIQANSTTTLSDNGRFANVDKIVTKASSPYTSFDTTGILDISYNATYNYANFVISPAVYFAGTYTASANSFIFASGFLFQVTPTIKNDNGNARALTSFYAINSQTTWQADNAVLTQSLQVDFVSQNRFSTINSGTLNAAAYEGYRSTVTVSNGATLTKRVGFAALAPTLGGSGAITNNISFLSDMQTQGTNNTHFLMGTTTAPSGNWGIYQSQAYASRWNAGHQFAYVLRAVTTTFTLTTANHVIKHTAGSATYDLFSAATSKSHQLIIINAGAGTITMNPNGADTINGTATIAAGVKAIFHSDTSTQWIRVI